MMNEMLYVREIIPVGKNRYKVILDEYSPFVLYKGELLRYNIKSGEVISSEDYNEICSEILVKRAKLRAMHLLEKMDYTEYAIRKKLSDYPPHIVDDTIDFLKTYHYINDERYVENFLAFRGDRMNKRQIKIKLHEKGVSSDLIDRMLESYEETDPDLLISQWINKKRFVKEEASDKEKRRMIDFLLRKGFSYRDISKWV